MKVQNWTPFKKSLCKTCWASCCHNMPVEASIPDLVRMGVTTEEEVITSLESVITRLKKEGIVQRFKRRSYVFILKQRKNGDCAFLDESRRCSIYEARPEICRQFPKIGPKPGFCPYKLVSKDRS